LPRGADRRSARRTVHAAVDLPLLQAAGAKLAAGTARSAMGSRRSLNNRRPSVIPREVIVKGRPPRLSGLEHPGCQCIYALRGERTLGVVSLGLDPLLARIDSGGARKRAQGLPGPALLVELLEEELRVAFAKDLKRFIF